MNVDVPAFVYEFDTLVNDFQLCSINTDAIGSDVTESVIIHKDMSTEVLLLLDQAVERSIRRRSKLFENGCQQQETFTSITAITLLTMNDWRRKK